MDNVGFSIFFIGKNKKFDCIKRQKIESRSIGKKFVYQKVREFRS